MSMMGLLRAVYDERAPWPSDDDECRQAVEDAEAFAMVPQLYAILQQRQLLNRLPEPLRLQLARSRGDALVPLLLIKQQTERLLERLDAEGVAVIPLKGSRFAERVFGDFAGRATSDIDLLVHATDVERAAHCVRELGFRVEEAPIPGHFHRSFSKPLPGSAIPLVVELHWSLLASATSRLHIDELWGNAAMLPPYQHVKELSELHTFYMILLHGWRHHMNSPKYFLDIVQMLACKSGEWGVPDLLRLAQSHQTYRRIVCTLQLVCTQFPHLRRELALSPGRMARWWEYEALRDSRSATRRTYLSLLSFQLLQFDSARHAFRALRDWLFPSPHELAFELGIALPDRPTPRHYLRLGAKRMRRLWRTTNPKHWPNRKAIDSSKRGMLFYKRSR